MKKLEGKVVLISGAARGQGEAIARLCVSEGAHVVLGDILDDLGKQVAAALGEFALYRHLDVTQPQDWGSLVAAGESAFGRLDGLVNNAGILTHASLETLALDDYRRTIEVNQVGCLLGMQAALPLLKVRGGSIVNTSSIAGLQGVPGLSAYSSTKWAIRGLTRTAAIELGACGIRVNSIHPGAIATEMLAGPGPIDRSPDSPYARVPLRRVGETADAAHLVLFLLSEDSSYCTGSEFTIDGGGTAGLFHRTQESL